MEDNHLKKIQNKTKLKQTVQDEINSPENQDALMQSQDSSPKQANLGLIARLLIGGLLLAGAISVWFTIYNMNSIGGWGIVIGLAIAGLFKAIYPNGFDQNNKIQRYIILALFGGLLYLTTLPSISEFAVMLIPSVLSAFILLGIIKIRPTIDT